MLEQKKLEKKHEVQMERIMFENERRKEERMYGMELLQMILGYSQQHLPQQHVNVYHQQLRCGGCMRQL